MKAIILAAGRGSRMCEATKDVPKCLMTLNNKTLLDRCLDSLMEAGFTLQDIGIVTGYRSEKVDVSGVKYFHNENWESTNMFVSLTMAKEWLKSETCIVCYSDIIFSSSVIRKIMDDSNEISITYYTEFWDLWKLRMDNPLSDLETFKLHNGKLIEIGKKPTCREEIHGQFMGIIRFTPLGWEQTETALKLRLPMPIEKLDMTSLLQHLLDCGYHVAALPTSELWLEFDSQDDIVACGQIFNV